jgi:hypothetical protein
MNKFKACFQIKTSIADFGNTCTHEHTCAPSHFLEKWAISEFSIQKSQFKIKNLRENHEKMQRWVNNTGFYDTCTFLLYFFLGFSTYGVC